MKIKILIFNWKIQRGIKIWNMKKRFLNEEAWIKNIFIKNKFKILILQEMLIDMENLMR